MLSFMIMQKMKCNGYLYNPQQKIEKHFQPLRVTTVHSRPVTHYL
jgi:hypothetical protein